MSKAIWLMSTGALALASAAPAYAQDSSRPTPVGSPAEAGAVQQGQPNEAVTVPQTTTAADIVVTAQGRRQVLQDVPLAVSAVSAETLQNSGVVDIRALNQVAPSLLISSTGTEANAAPRIRGIGTVGDNPGLESSVALFIDGVYRSRAGVGMNELGELERIEVLRGPQGTLFGRNASAGLLHIITKRPSFNFEGFAEATYGNFNNIRVAGGLTGPLGDTGLAFRLDAVYHDRDGFYRVVNAAGGTESRVNDRNRIFTRAQLLYEPTDALTIRLIGDYARRNESCCGAVYIDTRQKSPVAGQPGAFTITPNPIADVMTTLGWQLPQGNDPYSRLIAVTPGRSYRGTTDDWGVSGHVDVDLGGATLTSITAYRGYKSEGPSDTDYSNVDILFRADDGNSFRDFRTFTQELRLQGSAFNGFFDWLVGGYFAQEDLHLRDNLKFGAQYGAFASCRLLTALPSPTGNNRDLRNPAAPGCLSPIGTAVVTGAFGPAAPLVIQGLQRLSQVNNVGDNFANYYQDSRNYAFFTHNIFNLSDTVSATVGLRYTNERKRFSADFNNNNTICPQQKQTLGPLLANPALAAFVGGIVALSCQGNSSAEINALNLRDERSEGEWTGTGILSWKPTPQWLLYGSYSRGYKAGGFNLDRSALGNPLTPRAATDVSRLQFDPEIVNAFELGFKYTRRMVVFNAAFFHQRFQNFQLNTFDGSVFLVQNINACGVDLGGLDRSAVADSIRCPTDEVKAGVTSTGMELEAAIYPMSDLQITGGLTWARTRYRDNLIGAADGTPLSRALFLLPGQQMSNAPEIVATASLTYTPDLGGGLTGLVYVDARLTSDYNTGSDLFPEKIQDSFAVVNARLGVRGAEQRWSIELWAQNLFNQDYMQVAINSPFQGSNSVAHTQRHGLVANQMFSAFLAEPRTYGITGRVRF
jgi:iron complex outermembrane recepter protein